MWYVHLALSQLRDVLPYLCSDILCFHFLWKKSSSKEMSIGRDPWFFHFCRVEVGYRSWVTQLLGQVTEWSCPWLYPISLFFAGVADRSHVSHAGYWVHLRLTLMTHDSSLACCHPFCTILLFSGAFHDTGHILSLLAYIATMLEAT
jgi:hypothetical protein